MSPKEKKKLNSISLMHGQLLTVFNTLEGRCSFWLIIAHHFNNLVYVLWLRGFSFTIKDRNTAIFEKIPFVLEYIFGKKNTLLTTFTFSSSLIVNII